MQLLTVTVVNPERQTSSWAKLASSSLSRILTRRRSVTSKVSSLVWPFARHHASASCAGPAPIPPIGLACEKGMTIAAGHSSAIFLGDGFSPVNVLNAIKAVSEVCRIFARRRIPPRS
ncbi:hypothetical protein LMG28727_06293 [Paraburkholderia kirstenboschensis]|nr:hypothetical protein LMG28727_06293 [Paraburkholderia kirstenboschensis]